jgi:DNA-binding NarL/FixJ family response regulator
MAIRVAVIDDHTLVREALARLIDGAAGIEVIGSGGTGADARTLLDEHAPDVLLLDLSLAYENGLDLIPSLCARSPGTRILILSMHAEPEYAQRAQALGASGLISKSCALSELLEAIDLVSRGRRLPAGDRLREPERALLAALRRGSSIDDIAATLGLQPRTVETYLQRLMAKLDIHTRAGLIGYARRLDL